VTNQIQADLLPRYQRLIEISRELASTLDLNALLQRIVHAAADLCNAEVASILLYDVSKQELYFQAATNLDDPLQRGQVVSMDSLAGWIIKNQQSILIPDVSQDSRHGGEVAASFATRNLLGVPISTKHKVVGVLEAINKRYGQFTEQDQDLLMAMGAQAAVAIENTRLFQQSDLISEFVHELRTPLAALSTAAQIIPRSDISEEQRKRIYHTLVVETQRLSEMTTSFLDLARLESGRVHFEPVVFNISEFMKDCISVLKSSIVEKNQIINLNVSNDLPSLRADRDKIKQVVINLLSNAIKYTPELGTITIGARVEGKEMEISVSDTGRGIPPESLTHLFEKFYRVPSISGIAQGTGLGLSICKKIIEGHGGRIDVTSQVDVGTTFKFYLPLQKVAEEP
jgi:signal transduction histidine kinase